MFKKMLRAVAGTVLNDAFTTNSAVTTKNYESWLSMKNALDNLSRDKRYEIYICDGASFKEAQSRGFRDYCSDDDIIRKGIIWLEWGIDGKTRNIFCQYRYGNTVQSPLRKAIDWQNNEKYTPAKFSEYCTTGLRAIRIRNDWEAYIHRVFDQEKIEKWVD
tara:strand:+ start:165 stop:647 length:483 start_codon:yes stop_codon:yes gene_type:complete